MNIKAMIGALSLLAVCGVPTTAQTLPPAKGELPPSQPRSYQVGDKWVWQNEGNDRQFTHEIVAIDGPVATIRSGRCTFSTRLDGYSPTLAYENCPWGPWGKVQAERSGEIFPLQIGKTESWEYAGGTGQRTWSGVRECEVPVISGKAAVADVAGRNRRARPTPAAPWRPLSCSRAFSKQRR